MCPTTPGESPSLRLPTVTLNYVGNGSASKPNPAMPGLFPFAWSSSSKADVQSSILKPTLLTAFGREATLRYPVEPPHSESSQSDPDETLAMNDLTWWQSSQLPRASSTDAELKASLGPASRPCRKTEDYSDSPIAISVLALRRRIALTGS